MAKPMPALVPDGEMMAVLTPMTRPAESSSGPPELPGIDGGVGLDHVGDLAAGAGGQPAMQRADDAGGQRLVEAERVADREHQLSDLEVRGRADRDRRRQRPRVVHAQHREVVVGRGADDPRRQHLAGCESHGQRAGALDDVVVGDDVAGGVPDEARPGFAGAVLALGLRGLERAGAADDLHHGRRRALEQLDSGALELGEGAARRDRARRRRRVQQPVEIGLCEVGADDEHHGENGNPGEAVVHRRSLRANYESFLTTITSASGSAANSRSTSALRRSSASRWLM